MDDKRRAEQAIPLLGLAAIIATSMGYYLWLEPLRTFRPPIGDPPRPPLERNLPARLWQDPIGEARRSYSTERAANEPAQGEADPIELKPNHHLLLVQTYGGYSQLDFETRLRTRYAVGLALDRAGFVPDSSDTDALRFQVIQTVTDSRHRDRLTAKVVPFEYWKQGKPDAKDEDLARIVVLWVGDDIAIDGRTPLQTMSALLDQVVKGPIRHRPVSIIGPSSSGGLRDMAVDLKDEGSPDSSLVPPFQVYSPWATADETFLVPKGGPRLSSLIVRTIPSDRVVAGYLLEELKLRHLSLKADGKDEIALLSEWDTEYGRSLPVTFAACLLLDPKGEKCKDERTSDEFREKALLLRKDENAWPRGLKRVVYLRGLDGIGPRSGATAGGDRTKGDKSTEELERPDGSSQLDYARRLADEIARPAAGGRRLRAVGVLGSDIYDKLLLLQALSDRLPEVLFFTTDLDASFLHSSQSGWTRNLLVGSAFPLSMDHTGNAKLSPPFRDAYGIAVFDSVTMAVKSVLDGHRPVSDGHHKQVAVYEIGRTEAHRLTGSASLAERTAGVWKGWIWLLLALLVLPALSLLMTGSPGWRGLILMAATVLLFQGLYLVFGGAEPLYWIEGVSIWPSEFCRMISGAAALFLLTRIRLGLAQNRASICQDAGYLVSPGWPQPLSRLWWERLWFLLTARWDQTRDLKSIWDLYDEHDRPTYRYLRAGLLSAATGAFVLAASLWEDAPPQPCRDDSCIADHIISFSSIAAQILLLYVVVDVTLACSRWIIALRNTRSRVEEENAQGYPGAWVEIEFIARRTQEVSRLVLYPFLTLPLLILAQFSFFDRWHWPVSMLVIHASLLALALAAAIILRRSAETARSRACEEVRALRVRAIELNNPERAARMETALREIESESRGAFSPLSQNPVLAAVLLPVSGAGTGLALDSLLKTL